MSATAQWILIVLGLAVIAGLSWLIRRQWHHLSQARRARERTQQLQAERREKMVESIQILAMTIEQDQVEYSEGCIRIKGLLDHVAPELLTQRPYDVFQTMYEKTEHMPTHEARRQADPKLIRKLDEERFALEREYADRIREAAMAIRFYRFDEAAAPAAGQPQTFTPGKSTLQQ